MPRTAWCFAGIASRDVDSPPEMANEYLYKQVWGTAEAFCGERLSLDMEGIFQQVAVVTHGIAAGRLLEEKEGAPDLILEHSLGAYAALAIARAISPQDALKASTQAARFLTELGREKPGGLVAVLGLDDKIIRDITEKAGGWVANENDKAQLVIGGAPKTLKRVKRDALAAGALTAKDLPAPAAIHTPMVIEAQRRFQTWMRMSITFKDPKIPVISHLNGETMTTAAQAEELLANQLANPVRWRQAVDQALEGHITRFVDLGPTDTLGRIIRWINRDVEVVMLDPMQKSRAKFSKKEKTP